MEHFFGLGSLVHPPDSGPESAFPGGPQGGAGYRDRRPGCLALDTAARPAIRYSVP